MGGSNELGDGVCGADVPWWSGGARVVRRDLCRYLGDGPLQCLQLVSGAVAAAVLGASAPGFRSDARPREPLRGAWGGLAGAGPSDVYLVASGARGHLATLHVSDLYDAAAPRGRTALGSGESLRGAQNCWSVSRHPQAPRGIVDVR